MIISKDGSAPRGSAPKWAVGVYHTGHSGFRVVADQCVPAAIRLEDDTVVRFTFEHRHDGDDDVVIACAPLDGKRVIDGPSGIQATSVLVVLKDPDGRLDSTRIGFNIATEDEDIEITVQRVIKYVITEIGPRGIPNLRPHCPRCGKPIGLGKQDLCLACHSTM